MLRLADIFRDGCVLQREKPLRIFGETDAGGKLAVFLNDTLLAEKELSAGAFEVELPPREAAEDVTITVRLGEVACVTLRHVDIGEVWIAGGQSNMEFPLRYDREAGQLQGREDPHFRFFNVGRYAFPEEREEHLKPEEPFWERWLSLQGEESGYFSATAAWFGEKLRETLGVPVGIIGCNWGGTSALTWTDRRILEADDRLCVYPREYDAAVRDLDVEKYKAAQAKLRRQTYSTHGNAAQERIMRNETTKPAGKLQRLLMRILAGRQQTGPCDENRPGGLYEMMFRRIVPVTARGVIWYQGESDDVRAALYDHLFETMIGCWRRDLRDALPFFYVQLAPFDSWLECTGEHYPKLREKQQCVEDTVSETYMVSIMDSGSRYDIHPKEKRNPGERLARAALSEIYRKKSAWRAPRITSVTKSDGALAVRFDYADGGLRATGNIAELFSVSAGGRPIPCTAKVVDDTVELYSDGITKDGHYTLSFAYQPYLEMKLYNGEGLPARPAAPFEV